MNHFVIIGNLTSDADRRTVDSSKGPVTAVNFTVAVNRRQGSKDITDFVRCTAWGRLGEATAPYLTKGKKVMVSGPASAHAYTAQDGTVRAQIEIPHIEQLELLSPAQRTQGAAPQPDPQPDTFTEVNDDDLPF